MDVDHRSGGSEQCGGRTPVTIFDQFAEVAFVADHSDHFYLPFVVEAGERLGHRSRSSQSTVGTLAYASRLGATRSRLSQFLIRRRVSIAPISPTEDAAAPDVGTVRSPSVD
jgi:hypothetical protein